MLLAVNTRGDLVKGWKRDLEAVSGPQNLGRPSAWSSRPWDPEPLTGLPSSLFSPAFSEPLVSALSS